MVLLQTVYGYPKAASDPSPGWLTAAGARIERWRLRVSGREASIIPFVGEGRLLDVGCATGVDLERFQQAGWHVTGVEMSPYAASLTRARLGCEVVDGHFDEAPIEPRQFDAVRLSHVLEHLPSPRRSLEKIHRLLRPGGLLWLEVPNAASTETRLFGRHWFQWDLPRHLYHFTPETLTRMLRETGFRPRTVKCDGRVAFFAESLADVLAERMGLRRSMGKRVASLARPLVYLLGAINRGGILTVHAMRE
jgi:SAM-dependent methyltransferase